MELRRGVVCTRVRAEYVDEDGRSAVQPCSHSTVVYLIYLTSQFTQ